MFAYTLASLPLLTTEEQRATQIAVSYISYRMKISTSTEKAKFKFVYKIVVLYTELQSRFCIYRKIDFKSLYLGLWV
jgi:hypothetical protein